MLSILRLIRRHYRPLHVAIGMGIALTLLVLLVLQGLPLFARAELGAYDFQFNQRGQRATPNDIIFVGVDDSAIGNLGGSYPLSRHWLASAITFLHRAGARVIAMDFTFLASHPKDDRMLAAAIKGAGNVVLSEVLTTPTYNTNVDAAVSLAEPPDTILNARPHLGVTNINVDQDSGDRSLDLQQAGPDKQLYPSFAAVAASLALHKPVNAVIRSLPNTLYIDYVGPEDPGDASRQSLRYVGFDNLVLEPRADPSMFKDKIVVVGCAAITCNDLKTGPFGPIYGAALQVNAINTIIQRNQIVPVGDGWNNVIGLIMGLLATLVASRFGVVRSLLATALLAAGYAIIVFALFSNFHLWAHLVIPEVVVILVFAGVMGLRFATEERQRRRTSKIFGQYVKPEIVDILVNTDEDEKALAGSRRPITVLFVDIRGFTSMSEQMEPEDVVRALDIYLEELTTSIQEFDGTLDKYVGDELMAIWNAPRYQANHALLAVKSGLNMVSRVDGINEQLRELGLPTIGYGVGINSGDAVVGSMGSSFRKQYDVIGDTVNTAARLCGAAGRSEIIIGEGTFELIGDQLEWEETEPLTLKGKRRPFRTFLVRGFKSEAAAQREAGATATAASAASTARE